MKQSMYNEEEYNRALDMIIQAYIKVYGLEQWLSLKGTEQRDVIMIIAKDFLKAIGKA